MNKSEFLQQLKKELAGIPKEDREERLNFYSEMIDDRMEEGLSEEEAIRAIGSTDEIVRQTVTDRYWASLKNPPQKKNSLPVWVIVLLCVGAPLWISLAATVFSLIITAYAVIWTVVVTLWGAAFGTLCGCGVGGLAGGILLLCYGNPLSGVLLISAGLVCGGLAIFAFYGCIWTTKGAALLSKLIFVGIKNCFVRKEKKNA